MPLRNCVGQGHTIWRNWAGLTVMLFVLIGYSSTDAAEPATRPSPVSYRHEIRNNPPLHLHIVTINLTDPRVKIRLVRGGEDPDGEGQWQTTLQNVRAMATRENLAVAVNGHFFTSKDTVEALGQKIPYFVGNWAMATGWAMTDGVLWCKTPANASMVVDANGAVTIGRFGRLPANARQVVSGLEQIINHGRNTASSRDLAPRTGVGIDQPGKRLVLVVVDGRRDNWSVGMTTVQLADEMIRLGCYDAMNLDGGGSSTLVMRNEAGVVRLLSRPSDGHDLPLDLSVERPVADALGIVVSSDSPTTKP